MKYLLPVVALTFLCGTLSAESRSVITNAAELAAAITQRDATQIPFMLQGIALSRPPQRKELFFLFDETGGVPLIDFREEEMPAFAPGDRLLVSGNSGAFFHWSPGRGRVNAYCTNVVVLAHEVPLEPTPIDADDVSRDDLLFRPVRIEGLLVDVRDDEIDANYLLFVIDCAGRMAYAAAQKSAFRQSAESFKRLLGATVSVSGVLNRHFGTRIHSRRYVSVHGDDAIRLVKPSSDSLFDAPEIGEAGEISPEAVAELGRRRATGRVLAVWGGDTVLMRIPSNELMKVNLIAAPPAPGDSIEVAGYAETDLFHVNLARAVWRPAPMPEFSEETVTDISAHDLLADEKGRPMFNVKLHGRTVRLRGVVREMPPGGLAGRRIVIDDGAFTVAVDCSAAPAAAEGLRAGCTVFVTGVCVMETENWNRHAILPRTTGMFIAVRAPGDIQIVAMPSWWTSKRLLGVIGALVLLIVAILIWNASLRTLSERRGRELYRSRIDREKSELRLDERTRFAAELHDHIAQDLTAISYQVATAERTKTADAAASSRHLANAAKMLESCRTALRRCIWDLRSDALDEADVAEAIRKSVAPVAGDAEVRIDFNVPRQKVSDTILHATLSIVRELVANAVKHGHAQTITVTGALSEERLDFSVADDGCGFDAAKAPGTDEGHFGLAGIQERVRRHGGGMEMASAPGHGAKATIWLTLD